VANFTAEGRDPALDNKKWINQASAVGKP
jgi:hypothetical protein